VPEYRLPSPGWRYQVQAIEKGRPPAGENAAVHKKRRSPSRSSAATAQQYRSRYWRTPAGAASRQNGRRLARRCRHTTMHENAGGAPRRLYARQRRAGARCQNAMRQRTPSATAYASVHTVSAFIPRRASRQPCRPNREGTIRRRRASNAVQFCAATPLPERVPGATVLRATPEQPQSVALRAQNAAVATREEKATRVSVMERG